MDKTISTVVSLASRGYITNQIPTIAIEITATDAKSYTDSLTLEPLFNDKLIYFTGSSLKKPCKCGVNQKGTCSHLCFLSRAGVLQFKDELGTAWEESSKVSGFRNPKINTKELYIDAILKLCLF